MTRSVCPPSAAPINAVQPSFEAVIERFLRNFTGIDDPYEAPDNAEVVCATETESVQESAQKVIDKLVELKYLEA